MVRHRSPAPVLDGDRADSWRDRALCAGTDPEAFFPLDSTQGDHARRVCWRCPVRPECGEAAVGRGEQYGIWGGMSEYELRRAVRESRLHDPVHAVLARTR